MGASRAAGLGDREREFLQHRRVAHLATTDAAGTPHVVPVCFALAGETIYIAIDRKPKSGKPLKRLRNIAENPSVALSADHYDDTDWSRLRWVMVRGRAELLESGDEHDDAQARLCAKHRQLRAMDLAPLPVIAIRISRVTSWNASRGTRAGATTRESGPTR